MKVQIVAPLIIYIFIFSAYQFWGDSFCYSHFSAESGGESLCHVTVYLNQLPECHLSTVPFQSIDLDEYSDARKGRPLSRHI